MAVTIKEVTDYLEAIAPPAYQESYDNSGLITGSPAWEVKGVLVTLDCIEAVVEEAIATKSNLIIAHHPIIFKGLKKLTGKNYVERAVVKAIKNDIAIYAVHTALDNHIGGVNRIFADAIGLKNAKILIPKRDFIRKLVTFTVPENAEKVRDALFEACAGTIGNYDHCSFNSEGFSTYVPNEGSDPVIGERGKMTVGNEVKIEVTFKKHQQSRILKALFENHIYEEVAYEVYGLLNEHQQIGLGMIGELETAMPGREFLEMVKAKMQCGAIRHSAFIRKNIKKVAVLGGSGSFAITEAIASGADAYLTSDLKYHDFYQAENKILLADIGHFESERYTKNYIVDFLSKKITNFAIILSEINTNPVKYL